MKSFMQKTAVALALAVGVTSIPMGATVQAQAQAQESAYDKEFQVEVVNYDNNGGRWDNNSVIKNAFDGNLNTHWETRTANGKFKNEVIAQFAKEELIDSISYYPRVQGHPNKGFPTKYSIYVTQDNNPIKTKSWVKLQTETATVASGELKIKLLRKASVTGVKFVFEEAHDQWAAIGELKFYKPDPLTDEVKALFTDGTMSVVNKNVTPQYLKALEAKAKDHPSKHLLDKIKLAQDIVSGEKDVTSTVFNVEQRGNGETHARGKLKMTSYGSNLLPTGYASMAGQEVKVYVEVEDGKPLPQIVFSQQLGHWRWWKNTYTLKEGENIFTSPTIYQDNWSRKVEKGGAIYLIYPYTEEEGGNPKVRIEGAYKYPLFKDEDNVDEFVKFLKEYKEKQQANPKEYADIVEIVNDYAIINGNLQAAEVYLKDEDAVSPQDVLDKHEYRFKKLFALAGVSEDGEDTKYEYTRNGARANMRIMQPWAGSYAYAWGDHTGFLFQDAVNNLFNGGNYGWAIPHELGHHFDIKGALIGEVTNNMWANYNQVVINGQGDRIPDAHYDTIFKTVGSDNHKTMDYKVLNNLAIWWQLYLYDQEYWANYNNSIRDGVFKDYKLTKNELMVLASSYALKMDMTEYFVRHKFIDEKTAEKVKGIQEELGVPAKPADIKPWYMHTKAVKSDVKVFEAKYNPQIVEINKKGNNVELKLSIEDEAQKALLGYEIIRDDKVIGFTKSNTFVTLDDDGQSHKYQVRAYDIAQKNITKPSQPVVFDSSAPAIKVTNSTILKAGTPVSSVDSISAYDAKGKELDVIKHSAYDVSSSVYGLYTVNFGAIDDASKHSTKKVQFHTAAEVIYASELDAVATIKHGGLKKNTNINNGKITLLVNGKEQAFDYGVGAHANSQVEYTVNSQYDLFEAFIGLDGAVRGQDKANASFKVLADDKVIFESGAFTNKTEMEHIKLNIKGANKVTLITSSNGSDNYDHTIWADAKFARIEAEKDEKAVLYEVKNVLREALKDVNLDNVGMVKYNPLIVYPTNTEEEALVTKRLQESLNDKYTGSLNILVDNMNKKYKTIEDLIQYGSTISYKK